MGHSSNKQHTVRWAAWWVYHAVWYGSYWKRKVHQTHNFISGKKWNSTHINAWQTKERNLNWRQGRTNNGLGPKDLVANLRFKGPHRRNHTDEMDRGEATTYNLLQGQVNQSLEVPRCLDWRELDSRCQDCLVSNWARRRPRAVRRGLK